MTEKGLMIIQYGTVPYTAGFQGSSILAWIRIQGFDDQKF